MAILSMLKNKKIKKNEKSIKRTDKKPAQVKRVIKKPIPAQTKRIVSKPVVPNARALQARAREIILEARDEAVEIKNKAVLDARDKLAKINSDQRELSQREQELNQKIQKFQQAKVQLTDAKKDVVEQDKKLKTKSKKLVEKLEKLASLTQSEAKEELLTEVKKRSQADLARTIKEVEEKSKIEAENLAKEILIDAMRSGATDYVSEYTVSTIKIPNEEVKSKIIGKEGRNIRSFEKASGVDVIMDESPGEIKISSFNSLRREIAKTALIRLIKDGRIQPTRIEEYVAKAKREIEQVIFQEGRKLCQTLQVFNLPPE